MPSFVVDVQELAPRKKTNGEDDRHGILSQRVVQCYFYISVFRYTTWPHYGLEQHRLSHR